MDKAFVNRFQQQKLELQAVREQERQKELLLQQKLAATDFKTIVKNEKHLAILETGTLVDENPVNNDYYETPVVWKQRSYIVG